MKAKPHNLISQGRKPKRSYRLKEQIQAENLELHRQILKLKKDIKEALG